MIVPLRYTGTSAIVQRLRSADVQLAANTLREAVFFRGVLGQPLVFREALGALHSVVTSDLKYRPRDRQAFRAWLADQDRRFLASLGARSDDARRRLEQVEVRLDDLRRRRERRLAPFHRARLAYFKWACEHDYELAYLLDPVITVHPDEIFFEAFSRDESSYARLGVKHEAFSRIDEFECGTTNIDFSHRLAGELSRMRTYRQTTFAIGPSGLVVTTDESAHREKKIDLPDSWTQGFLQVHSTMALGLQHFRMAPLDLYNITRALKRRRARVSPRALRYELEPGRRVRAVLEPWEDAIELRAIYEGPKPATIRTWGRDRLLAVARLLPITETIDVYLAGLGLPSFYVFDMKGVTFTLALSGWTDNDWTGGAKFDLLARRLDASPQDLLAVYEELRRVRASTDTAVAAKVGFGVEKTRSALSHLCQVGRAMFDLAGGVYRHRDLFFEAFTLKEAAAALRPAIIEAAPQAQAAREIVETDNVRIIARRPVETGYKVSGSAKDRQGARVRPLISVDHQGQIVDATCTCAFFHSHRLTSGPCEHMLALRLAHMSRLAAEDGKGGGGTH